MSLDIQFKLKQNPLYIKFLRENSYWYKYLNRDPIYFKEFETEMKKVYKLNPSDKISRAIDTFDMLQALISTLKK
jgi:hypothetical protein